MKIGFFDSGIGGLAVLHKAFEQLPFEQFIYYADADNVPYGTKTKEDIAAYADEAVDFLVKKGAKAIVIACNTATSAAIKLLREKYTLPILGMEPAVKPAVLENEGKRVMVIATPLTTGEEKLKNLIDRVDEKHIVDLHPLPELVRYAEKNVFDTREIEKYLLNEFSSYSLEDYSVVVLGCTHFNFFRDTLARIFPKGTKLIEGSDGTIKYLNSVLKEKKLLEYNEFSVEYYLSGRPAREADLQRFKALHERLEQMFHY